MREVAIETSLITCKLSSIKVAVPQPGSAKHEKSLSSVNFHISILFSVSRKSYPEFPRRRPISRPAA